MYVHKSAVNSSELPCELNAFASFRHFGVCHECLIETMNANEYETTFNYQFIRLWETFWRWWLMKRIPSFSDFVQKSFRNQIELFIELSCFNKSRCSDRREQSSISQLLNSPASRFPLIFLNGQCQSSTFSRFFISSSLMTFLQLLIIF